MDKRKYQSKVLIAEYKYLPKHEDSRYSESAYMLKNGKIIIEYDGAPLSIYGLTIGFNKHIARKGVYIIDKSDYEMWKRICCKDENGTFTDWEEMQEEQFDKIFNTMFSVYSDNNILQLVIDDKDLPF